MRDIGLMNFLTKKHTLLTKKHRNKIFIGAASLLIIISIFASILKPKTPQVHAAGADDFVTTWRVAGDTAGRTVKIPVFKNPNLISGQSYNYTID